METVKASTLAKMATNIYREDWIGGAIELLMEGEYQYVRDDTNRYISAENAIADTDIDELVSGWIINNKECCDIRDLVRERIEHTLFMQLEELANDYDIGVK